MVAPRFCWSKRPGALSATQMMRGGLFREAKPVGDEWEGRGIQAAVIRDLELRREFGIGKYGTPLLPHNGRDALQDAYEEALDLCCYLKQAISERGQPGG